MDITYFEHDIRDIKRGRTFDIRTVGPDTSMNHYLSRPAEYEVLASRRVTLHLEVGDPVMVRAFGRMRPGTVTKLGRSKVTVDYQRSQQGTRATRAFGAFELDPFTAGPTHTRFTREDV